MLEVLIATAGELGILFVEHRIVIAHAQEAAEIRAHAKALIGHLLHELGDLAAAQLLPGNVALLQPSPETRDVIAVLLDRALRAAIQPQIGKPLINYLLHQCLLGASRYSVLNWP